MICVTHITSQHNVAADSVTPRSQIVPRRRSACQGSCWGGIHCYPPRGPGHCWEQAGQSSPCQHSSPGRPLLHLSPQHCSGQTHEMGKTDKCLQHLQQMQLLPSPTPCTKHLQVLGIPEPTGDAALLLSQAACPATLSLLHTESPPGLRRTHLPHSGNTKTVLQNA